MTEEDKNVAEDKGVSHVAISVGDEEIKFSGSQSQCEIVKLAVQKTADHARLMSELFYQARLAEFLSFALSFPKPKPEQNVTLEEFVDRVPIIFAQLAIRLFGTQQQREAVDEAIDAKLKKREESKAEEKTERDA